MATITPSTDLYLLKVPIELDNANQLTFANATAQYNYFSSLTKIGETNFSYQRRDNVIRYHAHVDSILQYNYVMYKNENYSNKWFYAYIRGMEYVNDNMTLITIEEDPFQTWQFDLTYNQSFVEREHVNDDSLGAHTVPEGLECGEYEINSTQHFSMVGASGSDPTPVSGDKWYVCFCVTEPPEPSNPVPIVPATGYNMGAVFTPLTFFAVSTANAYADARNILKWYEQTHQTVSEAIVNMYMIPNSCVDLSTHQSWTNAQLGVTITTYAVKTGTTMVYDPVIQPKVMAGQYTPRNAKLYSYPYCYLYLSNKSGSDVVYKWEDGEVGNDGGTLKMFYTFKGLLVPSASMSAKIFPVDYKGKDESSSYYGSLNYGISFGKVPVCAWINDYYTNWLTQNGVNSGLSLASGLVNTAISAVAGNPVGILGGVAMTANALAERHRASVTPPQAEGDVNCGDVTYAYTLNNITAYQMTIRKEMAQIIDKYFDKYGYKVDLIKVPNITGRTNWNYVKTIDCSIHGYIPQDSCDKIKQMLNNGVTFWHNPATFLDYTQTNAIVS